MVCRTLQRMVLAGSLLALGGCGDGTASDPMASVELSPLEATVAPDESVTLAAVVKGCASGKLLFSVVEDQGGVVTSGGVYRAPEQEGDFHVRAVCSTAPTAVAQVTIHIRSRVAVSVSPAAVDLRPRESLQFTATVTGTSNQRVVWSVDGAQCGTISSAGLYQAPSTSGLTCRVRATSAAALFRSGTAAVRVTETPTVGVAVSPATASLAPGSTQQFVAAITGSTNPAVTWSVVEADCGSIDSSGRYTAPARAATCTVRATSAADSTRSATATATITAAPSISVTLSPAAVSLMAGNTQQFAAAVIGSTNQAVTWSVVEAGCGSVDSSGRYTAPARAATCTIRATSAADSAKTATATASIIAAPVISVTVSPATASLSAGGTQQFAAAVSGSTNQAVTWSVVEASCGSIDASGRYTAPARSAACTVRATSAADPTKSATAAVGVAAAPAVSVTVSPATASLSAGGTQQFTATVSGSSNQAVTWSVVEASCGSIDASGRYTAPARSAACTVRATSAADPTKSATAAVTVAGASISIVVIPSAMALRPGAARQLAATVTGASSTSVTWSVDEGTGCGSVSSSGLYQAPATEGTCHVRATSAASPAASAAATVTVSSTLSPAPFVTGYFATWQGDWLPLTQVKWSDLTHFIPHRIPMRRPGSSTSASNPYQTIGADGVGLYLGSQYYSGADALARFASEANQHGVKALFGFGGSNSVTINDAQHPEWCGWSQVLDPALGGDPARFAQDVVAACKAWGYSGLDIDFEDDAHPITYSNWPAMLLDFVRRLRAEAAAQGLSDFTITWPIGGINSNGGLDPATAAVYRSLEPYVDQFSPMSYTLTGAWDGWTVWHNNPLFGHGTSHPNDMAYTLEQYANAGIPKSKLGGGVGFYGIAVGPGGNGPFNSPYDTAPGNSFPNPRNINSDDNQVSLHNIALGMIGQGGAVENYDAAAEAAYLTWATPFHPTAFGIGGYFTFVSYENERSAAAKAAYLRQNGYGGAMIWTLNEGAVAGYASPVLDALAAGLLGGSTPAVSVSLSPTSASLAWGGAQAFTATVTGATDTRVTYSVSPATGCGSIDAAGRYTAPSADATCTVVATSVADGAKTARATVSVRGGSPTTRLQQLQRLATRAFFFGHRSVGDNVVGSNAAQGLRGLLAANPGSGLAVLPDGGGDGRPPVASDGSNLVAGTFGHTWIGANGDPLGKVRDFVARMNGGLGAKLDALHGVAFMKFCFADFDRGSAGGAIRDESQADALFAAYQTAIASLKAAYPHVRFVHVTVPLLTPGNGGNDLREYYSDKLRADPAFQADGIFDLAHWESTDQNGVERRNEKGLRYLLYGQGNNEPSYTTDNCHPGSALGENWIAGKLVDFLSSVVQP